MAHTLILAMMMGTAQADELLVGRPDGVGVGLVLGSPTGISLAKRESDEIWQAAVGWNAVRDALHVNVDRLLNISTGENADTPNTVWPIYVGAGLSLRLGGDLEGRFDSDGDDASLGIRVPMGITMLPRDTRLDVFFEIVPVMALYPATGLYIDSGLGARFYL